MTTATALLLSGAALLLWPAAGSDVARRLRDLRVPAPPSVPVPHDTAAIRRRRRLLAAGAGLAAALLLGGVLGAVVGVAVAGGTDRLLRDAAPDDARQRHAGMVRELPVACDLLAVCLAAGVPVGGALAAVGSAVSPPLGPPLTTVAGLYRLGAEPRRAWADAPEPLTGLGRVLVRAGESGAAVAPALRDLAADGRAELRAATEAAVRRAGIWILAPLGLCFLPAFVCLGVVPLVLGIAADVFG
jgi:membrane protein YqaA with SNARE-associated domain